MVWYSQGVVYKGLIIPVGTNTKQPNQTPKRNTFVLALVHSPWLRYENKSELILDLSFPYWDDKKGENSWSWDQKIPQNHHPWDNSKSLIIPDISGQKLGWTRCQANSSSVTFDDLVIFLMRLINGKRGECTVGFIHFKISFLELCSYCWDFCLIHSI